MPKISVVMSVYNGERYLKEAVESILSQSFQDFEFIIVNDGSTDGSKSILQFFARKDPRIRIIDQQNIGLTKSLNKAISFSRGEFIARQDVDDISFPERLAKQYESLSKEKDADLACSWYYIIDESGETILERKLPDSSLINKIIKRENVIAHSSVMFRKSSFLQAGGYEEKYKYGQDWFLWLKMKNIKVLPECLLKYRWGNENITHKRHLSTLKVKDKAQLLEYRKVCIISSILLQQAESKKCREILKKKIFSIRNIFYYLLTFLPRPVVLFCIWDLRYHFKSTLRKYVPYCRKKVVYE